MRRPVTSCVLLSFALAVLVGVVASVDAATATVVITPNEVDYGGPYYAGASEYLDAQFMFGSTCQTYGGGTITTQNVQNWAVTAGDEEETVGTIVGAEQPRWVISAGASCTVYAYGACDDFIEDEYWARARGWVGATGDLSYKDGYEAKVANKETEARYTWTASIGGVQVEYPGKRIKEGGLIHLPQYGTGDSKTLNQATFRFYYASGTQIALYASGDTDEVTGRVNENNPAIGYGHNQGFAYALDGDVLLGMWYLD